MCKYFHITLVFLSALGLTALFVIIAPVQEAILASPQTAINVNTLEDEDNVDGDCSLREAIRAANENNPVDACPQGETISDTIRFGVNGTITLTEQLSVTAGGRLMIDGTSAITISGADSVRLFYVESGARLTLEGLNLINGWAYGGGAISTHGNLTINNSILSENKTPDMGFGGGIGNWDGTLHVNNSIISSNSSDTGGGIYNNGSMRVYNTTLSNNIVGGMFGAGGGIDNGPDGKSTILNSILSGNSAQSGGGVYNTGILTITSSTLSGNHSGEDAGGISNTGLLTITHSTLSENSANDLGGGIYNTGEKLTILNSTLSGNSSAENGGGIYNAGLLDVKSTTFFGNSAALEGGGIYNVFYFGTATLNSTIITSSPVGGNCAGDPMTDAGYNLEDTDTCFFNAYTSLPNTDPLLAPLRDNGGPAWTHALAPDSPAIDAGDPVNCPPTDQRGVIRPIDGDRDGAESCDIGSYEFDQVITLSPAFQSSSAAPGETLVYTLVLTNSTSLTDTYTLALGAHAWEVELSEGSIGPLTNGGTQPFTVSVSIPLTATTGMIDTVIITATSMNYPIVFWDTAQIYTQAIVSQRNLYLPIVARTE